MLRRVRPTVDDRARMREISRSILERIELMARSRGLNIKAILVGSAARDTWLAGDHDLDIFLGMPEGSDLGTALQLAREVAPVHEEKYAEHAYVHAFVDGFDVDLVPCYLVKDACRLKSAVDRTPFHTKYIAVRIAGLEDDVLLLKQFMKGIGVYGSELKVGGFSGYLTELLVLRYGSFSEVLKAASSWRPGEVIDLEGHARGEHHEPLVVVDPVDPSRNVAAALTLDRMLQFVAASRCFLQHPDLEFFFPPAMKPLSDEELRIAIDERGSALTLIEFQAPDVVEDVLFPQLRKAEEAVKSLLERSGFSLLRSDVGSYGDKAVLLFELDVWQLPRVSRRMGPPVWEAEHLSRFLAAHPHAISGPYIEGGRAVVELPRRYTSARDLLASEIGNLSLGRHLSEAVRRGHNIYVGEELAGIKDGDFRVFMARYLKAKTRIC
ncbi:MAG: CCA tRNA nucleotidyltransferase [Methanotrichaceae archaeon]|nr:CCA tRNA nucleotidyltransferase [Methanotrichaceae archaeon]